MDGVGVWRGKKVVVLGLARQGKSTARYLAERGAHVVISDLRTADELAAARQELIDLPLEYALGGHPPDLLEGADLLCLSGGVPSDLPLAQQARLRGVRLTNDSQLFLETRPATTIGVTGSAGKTTTTALVGRMIEKAFEGTQRRVWVGGNIGNPLLTDLAAIKPDDLVVMELSSFQLELMTVSPPIAAILNVTPNHLDRHRTMEAYTAAKARILAFQSQGDSAVLGRDDPGAWGLRTQVRGRLLSYGVEPPDEGDGTYLERDAIRLRIDGGDHLMVRRGTITLRGEHNLMNVLAACALAGAIGLPQEAVEAGVRGFEGLPHRLEFVRRVNGVDWYNDSIATAPERAMAAIRAFEEPIVLLAGGRDKDLDWRGLTHLIRRRVDHLVLFGEAAGLIAVALEVEPGGDRPFSVEVVSGLDEAVQVAAHLAEPGDVVLLAPGGTSFDEFTDFAERGDRFKALVRSL